MKKLLILLLALPTLVSAEIVMGPPLSMMMTSGYVYSSAAATLSQDVLREEHDKSRERVAERRPVSLDVRVSAREARRVAQDLAASFPASHRDDAAKMYETLFKTYEDAYPRTISGALAALLAGSYAAYHNAAVPDAHSLAVLEQFDRAIRADPTALHALREDDKKVAYTQMIMLGMQLMASAMKNENGGGADEISRQREAGQRNLEDILSVPAGQVRIGRKGLAVR